MYPPPPNLPPAWRTVNTTSYDFHGRKSRFMVDADRDPAPVVTYGNRIILIDIYLYLVAISGKRLVNGVVHDLIDQMMKTSG